MSINLFFATNMIPDIALTLTEQPHVGEWLEGHNGSNQQSDAGPTGWIAGILRFCTKAACTQLFTSISSNIRRTFSIYPNC